MDIKFTKSAADIATTAAQHMTNAMVTGDAAADLTAKRQWANELLTNQDAMQFAHSQFDPQVIGEAIDTRAWDIRERYEEDREPNYFLDFFRDRGLLHPINPGTRGDISAITSRNDGEIRFVADKTDDWPTSTGGETDYKANFYKHFGGAVELGIFEAMEAANQNRDLLSERLRAKLSDIDKFLDEMIALGAPLHGIYGLATHPDIPSQVVPAGVSGFTDWPNKLPGEIKFDLQLAMETIRTGSKYNATADILMMSDLRYTLLATMSVTPEGRSFLSQLSQDFSQLEWAKPEAIKAFTPFDTAGAGDTPIMLAGKMTKETIEFPVMPTMQLAPEYSGTQWKIGMFGMCGSVNVKRPNRIIKQEGI